MRASAESAARAFAAADDSVRRRGHSIDRLSLRIRPTARETISPGLLLVRILGWNFSARTRQLSGVAAIDVGASDAISRLHLVSTLITSQGMV
jgi:hypothetical protein